MTIQTKNQTSIELFHKSKLTIVLTILFIVCILAIIIYFIPSEDGYSTKIYDSPDSIETVFLTNQALFVDTANILKDSELFDYLYEIDRKSIFSPTIPNKDKYLTEEEYENICIFLDKFQPYEIGRNSVGGGLHFVFLCKNHDVIFYYTEQEGEALSDFLRYVGQHSEIKTINKNWYIGVSYIDITRPS